MIWCKALFARGSGLGNRLFPWARCVVFAHQNDARMLAPRWFQPRLGPLFRGVSLRYYHRQILMMGLFKRSENDVRGLRRFLLEASACKASEPQDFWAKHEEEFREKVVVFEGDRDHFAHLTGWERFLLEKLRASAREKWVRSSDEVGVVPIALNVRRSRDFPDPNREDRTAPTGPVRTPLAWFIESLRIIRQHVGYPAKAFAVSDSSGDDLRELLAEENVFFVRPGCAISDLLVMSKARVLLGSGGSSFSAWGSFLGQMPTISFPGQSLTWFRLGNRSGPYVGEFDPKNPNETFVEQAKETLAPVKPL